MSAATGRCATTKAPSCGPSACCARISACAPAGGTMPTPRSSPLSPQRPEQKPHRVTTKGVGARLPRKEDRRFLRGEGEYVSNIRLPGMLEVAFVRSQMAHARLGKIVKPGGKEDCVFTAEDLVDVRAIRAVSSLKGFKVSEQP